MKEEQINKEIEFISKLKELKSIVKELKEIFSDKPEYKVYIEDLENMENYIKELESTSTFNLEKGTVNEISINQMNSIIQQYNQYYKLYNNIMIISQELPLVNEDNINILVEKCVQVHKILVSSELDNHKEIELLLSDLYTVVYNVMKLEVIFSSNQNLFNFIKNDESKISHPYISELIEKDVLSINDNHELLLKLKELKSNGIDSSNIIDLDLLTSITKMTMKNIKIECKESMLEDIDSYEKMKSAINESEEKYSKEESIVLEAKQEKREAFGSVVKKLTIYGMNVALVIGVGVGMHLVEKNISRKYYTTTTTYNSETGEYNTSKPKYEKKENFPIKIIKETPWEEDNFTTKTYRKDIYTYSLSENEDYNDLSDYIDYLLVNPESYSPITLKVSEKPAEFGKKETVYIVQKKEYDENNYKDIDLKNHLFDPINFSLFAGVIDLLILAKNNNISNNLKGRLNNHKRTKKNLIAHQKLLQKTKKELGDVIKEREELYKKIIGEYNELPNLIQEDEQLKTSIQKIKK